jgi:dGTPase
VTTYEVASSDACDFRHVGVSPDRYDPYVSDPVQHLPDRDLTVRDLTVRDLTVRHAHRGAYVGSDLQRRDWREAELDVLLAPGATRAIGAGDRLNAEDPDPFRLCFERDLDRIKHSRPWRRLAGKCQVFIAPENDHLRTRLTHAVEVAQVATGIARATGLNVALTEAIALAHDCGHGPAGHASEEAFSPFVPGGYDHAVYGADVTLAPLNLCRETLDGIRNHSWRRPAPATPEGEVVAWADRIAYVCHDFEDAVRAGILVPEDLPPEVADAVGRVRSAQIGAFMAAVFAAVEQTAQVGMTESAATALARFRAFNFERIYLRPAARRQAEKVIALLRGLVEFFVDAPSRASGANEVQPGSSDAAARAVHYVSGMTDRYALALGVELLGWRAEDLPRGV